MRGVHKVSYRMAGGGRCFVLLIFEILSIFAGYLNEYFIALRHAARPRVVG